MTGEARGSEIRFERVSLRRGETLILDAIDLTVAPSELLVLVGPSGSGKSTLMKLVNRLVEPTAGSVHIDDADVMKKDLTALRRSVGYCFQALGLFPHMTVGENVGIGLRLAGEDPKEIRDRVDDLLRRVTLDPKVVRDRLPSTMSGGQQQRVAVARALAVKPRVLLLDEPFGALDPETREKIQQELLEVVAAEGPTTLLVSHDLGEALTLGHRIAVLHGGRLLRVAAARDLVRDPGDERIEALLSPARNSARTIVALSGDA